MVLLSFFSYFFYYFVRKNLGVVTPDLVDQGVFTTKQIGWAQTGYAALYMIGQFINGALGDRYGARALICFGMLSSSIASIIIGIFPFYGILLAVWSLNGLFQSTGWSNNCKIIASWIPFYQRGRVMGFWALCYVLGSISANFFAGYLMGEYGWKSAFLITGCTVLVISIIQGIFLINTPEEKGFSLDRRTPQNNKPNSKRGFFKMISNPLILLYGGSYFSLKFIRYTFFTWLPFYLFSKLGYDKSFAAYTSNAFEIGGVLGLLIGGFLADRFFRANRGRLACFALVAMTASLFLFRSYAHSSTTVIILCLAFVGATLYIADSLVSGTAAQDIGGAESAASATGIVNGIGSLGGVLSGILPVYIQESYGWDGVFILFIALSFLAIGFLTPVAFKKEIVKA
jgi:sugar phosphate permease